MKETFKRLGEEKKLQRFTLARTTGLNDALKLLN